MSKTPTSFIFSQFNARFDLANRESKNKLNLWYWLSCQSCLSWNPVMQGYRDDNSGELWISFLYLTYCKLNNITCHMSWSRCKRSYPGAPRRHSCRRFLWERYPNLSSVWDIVWVLGEMCRYPLCVIYVFQYTAGFFLGARLQRKTWVYHL